MFTLYRDGFMLLVMGYTGKKALAVKLAYIEAFNRMEVALAAATAPAPGPARRNIADDIIPTPPYAPALGWADAPLTRAQERVISEKQRGR